MTKLRLDGETLLLETIATCQSIVAHANELPDRTGYCKIGIALLRRTIELAEAGLLCCQGTLVSAAWALVRPQYESALRAHVLIHELDEENARRMTYGIAKAVREPNTRSLPELVIRDGQWSLTVWKPRYRSPKRWVRNENLKTLHERLVTSKVQNDLTHGGLRTALNYMDMSHDPITLRTEREWTEQLFAMGAARSLTITVNEATKAVFERLELSELGTLERQRERTTAWCIQVDEWQRATAN